MEGFQPLHNQHLEYIMEAKKEMSFFMDWITHGYQVIVRIPQNPHRCDASNNPLTYFERINIIQKSLVSSGVNKKDFAFIPFPIENPEKLPDFLPTSVPIYTTICDEWNSYKITILEKVGYKVIVLFNRESTVIRGKIIRSEILNDGKNWENLVPESTVDAVYKLDLERQAWEYYQII